MAIDKNIQKTRAASIRSSEAKVNRAVGSLESFVNPFETVDKVRLYGISSGAAVSQAIEESLLESESVGEIRKQEFIQNCMVTSDKFSY